MSRVFAVLTSDPNLIACELRRSEGSWDLGRPASVGLGSYGSGDVLLQDASGDTALLPPSRLWKPDRGRASAALLYCLAERTGGSGGAFDGQVPPWRFRQWLFGQGGNLPESAEARARVHRSLPEFLRRQVPGLSEGEVAFGVFLRKLHEAGALEQLPITAEAAGRWMASTVRVLIDLYASAGTESPALSLVASNGSLLTCARQGAEPLWYTVHRGLEGCRAEHSPGDAGASAQLHRRLQSVIVASRVSSPEGWTELPAGSVLTVDGKIEPKLTSL